jgi:hypothetical protein
VRRTTTGELDLRSILDGMDRSLVAGVQKTIETRDPATFSKAYRDARAAATPAIRHQRSRTSDRACRTRLRDG